MRNLVLNLLHLSAVALSSKCSSDSSSDADHRTSYHTTEPPSFLQGRGFGNATLRYLEVPPKVCELHPGVKSYSGYVDISEHEHMFFWFFEARNVDPKTAPLTAWTSGGPGDASMSELFTEHGPCRIHPDGKTVHYNPFSWNNYSNVIYIDQPVQVGFSYTDLIPAYLKSDPDSYYEEIVPLKPDEDCPDDAEICGNFSKPDTSTTANSTLAAAPNFWTTLQAFMATFPQYSSHGFHFGSESYGGHYVPVFSRYILDQNDKNIPGATHIDLKSILVGNGWFSPQIQYGAFYSYAFDPGNAYDLGKLNESTKEQVYDAMYGKGNCSDQLKVCDTTGSDDVCVSGDAFCAEYVEQPFLDETGRNINDVRELGDSPFPNEFYADYLQLPEVRQAIGANQTYIELNPTVGAAFLLTGDDGRELGILKILGELLESGVRVTLYAGDADYECNWLGVEAVADAIGVAGYDKAGYTDISTPDNIVHGQVKQSGGFSMVRVYQAGHAVGAFQPFLQQTIFARGVAGKDLATGKVSADAQYRSKGPTNSTYHEGNSTVQSHSWPDCSTYNMTSNLPTFEDYQPVWNGPS